MTEFWMQGFFYVKGRRADRTRNSTSSIARAVSAQTSVLDQAAAQQKLQTQRSEQETQGNDALSGVRTGGVAGGGYSGGSSAGSGSSGSPGCGGAGNGLTPCLSEDMLVETENGSVHVADLRGATSRLYEGKLVTLRFVDGASLRATPDHRLQTSRGAVKAAEVRAGDCLLPVLGSPKRVKEVTYEQFTGLVFTLPYPSVVSGVVV